MGKFLIAAAFIGGLAGGFLSVGAARPLLAQNAAPPSHPDATAPDRLR